MKALITALFAVLLLASAERLFAHGFELLVSSDSNGNATSVSVVSNQPVLDQDPNTPAAGPDNLFLDTFFIQTSGPNTGGLGTVEGGPQVVGPSPAWANAYFTILSPLYYSDGTGTAAVPAPAGTYFNFYDRFPDNSDGNHPGASNGNFDLSGSAARGGFVISLDDFHEVEKDLILGPGSTQTNGEYGYAFDVTIPFTNGATFTTGPLVDVFATGTTSDQNDPNNTGFGLEPDAQQDAATSQVYGSVMAAAVPEPSTIVLAAGWLLLGLARRRHFCLFILAITLGVSTDSAWGHGFEIAVNSTSNPTALGVSSEEGLFNNQFVATTPVNGLSPENMFIAEFSAFSTSGTMGSYYSVLHGGPVTSGPYPAYTATFNVVSPLYFSDGVGSGVNQSGPVVAEPASAGTFLNVYDIWAGNPDPVTEPHPGAGYGDTIVTGTTSFAPGFSVSLYDPHEIEHDLYLSPTSTQTYGEYGFAYTVTIHFPNTGATLTTVPLVDVYALSDPNLGDFPDNAGIPQQNAASVAIFQAATRNEPPSWSMAASGSWNDLSNWMNWPGNGIPGSAPFGAGVQVAIDAATTSSQTITLDGPQTIGTLIFGNSASNSAGYALAPGTSGTLTLTNLTAGAQILITGGSNSISANSTLADNLTINPSAGATLVISGNLSESTTGETLTLAGAGTLVLSGSNTYTGGTNVAAGTLDVLGSSALPDGSDLTVGCSTAFAPAISSPAAISPVSEPGTPALLVAGAALTGIFRKRCCCSNRDRREFG